jgi:hypothetical protein
MWRLHASGRQGEAGAGRGGAGRGGAGRGGAAAAAAVAHHREHAKVGVKGGGAAAEEAGDDAHGRHRRHEARTERAGDDLIVRAGEVVGGHALAAPRAAQLCRVGALLPAVRGRAVLAHEDSDEHGGEQRAHGGGAHHGRERGARGRVE